MRRLLLDTHVFLWWLADHPRLGPQARAAIQDPVNPVFVSAVTDEGFSHLPISFFHGEQAGLLPDHHRDPFERMLVAQAQAEGLVILTADPQIASYGIRTLPAQE